MVDFHCESCGRSDPCTDEDGYTTCCNELVCGGGVTYRFGNPSGLWVTACCWGEVSEDTQDKMFEQNKMNFRFGY